MIKLFNGNKEYLQTLIIPTKRDGFTKKYTIEIDESLWNEFQIVVLSGMGDRNVVGYFDVKDTYEPTED